MINRQRYFAFATLTTMILLILLSSCRPEPVASEDASVIILQPSADSILFPNSFTVRTFVNNFTLVNKIGQANLPGEGHIIFYLDVTPPLISGQQAQTVEGSFIISDKKSYTWENVTPGQHLLWVQLVNNDNSVLEPPAAVRVPVTVVNK